MASRLLSRTIARTPAPALRPARLLPGPAAPAPVRATHHRSRNLTLATAPRHPRYSTAASQAARQQEEEGEDATEQLSEYPSTSPAARRILRDTWGYASFRLEQEAVITRLLHGGSAVAVFPTGAGKSLLYQVAALGLGDGGGGGVTVVVSPLIALIKDQVQDLRRRGIQAAAVDSTMERAEVRAVFERVRNDELRLLYVSPERLNNGAFTELLSSTTVRLVAVDEAHCVYEWGNSFRPDYLRVARFVREIKAERVLCVTATATPETTESISAAFGVPRDGIFRTSTYRPNLQLLAQRFRRSRERLDHLVDFLDENPGATIIYVLKRSQAETVAALLVDAGIDALPYHAGMDKDTRSETQDRFMKADNIVIVATVAFGLGINKPNIRNIVHFGPPLSIENYAQEIGRAGRDNLPSKCLILTAPSDTATHDFLTANPTLTPRKTAIRRLLQHLFSTHAATPPGTTITLPLHAYAKLLAPRKRPTAKDKEGEKQKPLPRVLRDNDDSAAALTALLAKLELAFDFLRALPQAYGAVEYRGHAALQGLDDHLAAAVVAASSPRSEDGLWGFDLRAVAGDAAAREAVLRRVQEWERDGVVEAASLGVAARYVLLRELPEVEGVVERLHGIVKMQERRGVERRKSVLELVKGKRCFVGVLARHFGDEAAAAAAAGRGGCGHCQWCIDRAGRRGGRA